MLDEEIKYFDEHWEEWEAAHPGKYVLIQGTTLHGFFDSRQEAVDEGYRRLHSIPFLARPLSADERVIHVPAVALGVPYAHPQHPVKR